MGTCIRGLLVEKVEKIALTGAAVVPVAVGAYLTRVADREFRENALRGWRVRSKGGGVKGHITSERLTAPVVVEQVARQLAV